MADGTAGTRVEEPSGFGRGRWTSASLESRPARLSVVVVSALVDRIVSGEYPAGSLLPPEPALCESFGVSRSVIREASKALEEKGLARARQGHGTTVTSSDEWNLLDPVVLEAAVHHDDTLGILDDLVEARVALECQMVRAAAGRMTTGDVDELGGLVSELKASITDPDDYHDADNRYHDLIHRCSGNRLGRSIIRSIHPFARASVRYTPALDEEDIVRSHVQHVVIYERLKQHDAEGAAKAMEEHIMGSWMVRKEKASRSRESTAATAAEPALKEQEPVSLL